MGYTFAGPVLACFSQHRSKFPSEEFLASGKFSLCLTNVFSRATLTRIEFSQDATQNQSKPLKFLAKLFTRKFNPERSEGPR